MTSAANKVPADKVVVVTGSAGFIGANLVNRLAARGWRVVCCDWLHSAERLAYVSGAPITDWFEPEALSPWMVANRKRIAGIIHLGAITSTLENRVDQLLRWNLRYTIDLWKLACKHNWRFLYASSAATYGDGRSGFLDTTDEAYLAGLRPLNPYGWSKHVTDRRIVADWQAGTSPRRGWAGFKFFNVYGPLEQHKGAMASMVSRLLPQVRAGQPVDLFESHREGIAHGDQRRDFIHVDDVCAALERALGVDAIEGLFNLGTGNARSFVDLARAVAAALGVDPDIRFVPMPAELREQYQYFTCAEVSRIRSAGLLLKTRSLEQGVAETARCLLKKGARHAA